MKYRRFGKLDWEVSVLGFGAMRLPTNTQDRGDINEAEAIQMMRYAFDHGVNYVDTAYPYHDGKSEVVVGKALKDGYREKVRLATKMPLRLVNSREDLDRILAEQLSRLQVEYIDFYLLHGVNRERWSKVLDLNVLDWLGQQVDDGRLGYLGFSFHDEYDVFEEVIDRYEGWTFCQIQYNYLDSESSTRTPGTRGLNYAASKGLAVVVMEPLQGGKLGVQPPAEVQTLWDVAPVRRSPAEWALQWVWSQLEVSVALSGMSTLQQVVENVESASRSSPGLLSEKELDIIARVRERYLDYGFIGCTGCGYCVPCPQGVAIPSILALCNDYFKCMRDESAEQEVLHKYAEDVPAEKRAGNCVRCRECEDKCPQGLPISELMARAVRQFE